MLIVNRFNF